MRNGMVENAGTGYGYRIRIPDTGYGYRIRIPDTDTGYRIRIPDSLKYLFLRIKIVDYCIFGRFFLISKIFDLNISELSR
jgi:hypothetical protein